MGTLDGNDYRKRVMTRLAADFTIADPETGDPFFVLDLDPATATATDVRERLSDVVAFWQKERNSVKYKGIAAALVAARPRYEAVLTDPARRAEAARRVLAERGAAESERMADLDRLAGQLTSRHGGIPAGKVEQLRMLGRRKGLDDAAFAGWLARHPVIPDESAQAQPWDAAIRSQIRSQLDELARGAAQASRFATLWTFLDLSPACSDADLAGRHAELLAENQRSRHTADKTRAGELLAHVKTRLMADGGRAAYAASLRADARDRVEPDVAEMVIVDGEVTPSDYEILVQRLIALGWGLSTDDAREAVRAAATALGASLAVAPAVDYVLCGSCRSPQPEPRQPSGARCRYCGEALYTTCPSCGHVVVAAATTCPDCGTSFQAHREAAQLIQSGRDELAAGRPRAAREHLSNARERLGQARPSAALGELAAAVDAALEAAARDWLAVEADLSARRLWAAYDRVARLVRTAGDVPGPRGTGPQDRLRELADAKASVRSRVRAAARLEPAEAEQELTRALAEAVDCPEAAAALAAIPMAGPTDVLARVLPDGVEISWRPSTSRGQIGYRVVRVVEDGTRAPVATTIATTSATQIEDAGAPGGAMIRYQVSAVSGRRASPPAGSDQVLVERDVSALVAEPGGDGVRLRWDVSPGQGVVMIERAASTLPPGPDGAIVPEGPTRRIRPTGPGRHVDTDVRPGNTYSYRVYVEYRRPGAGTVRTTGKSATVRVTPRPVPVTGLRAVTEDGRTSLSFAGPPAGEVAVYATGGPGAAALGPQGRELDVAELARLAVDRSARLVGTGRRRVVDPQALGRVVFTPVTVVEGRAVLGAALEHWAVDRVRELAADDRGDAVVVTFAMPAGVTEAYVAWRNDAAPASPGDPRATVAKVTNTKLEIDGGFEILAPRDGRGLWVAVWPAVRVPGTPQPVPGPTPAVLGVREERPVLVRYSVRRAGLWRRTLAVDVDAGPDPLPAVVLVGCPGTEPPAAAGEGTALCSAGGDGSTSRSMQIGVDQLPADESTLRLFLAGPVERTTTLEHPEPAQLTVRR